MHCKCLGVILFYYIYNKTASIRGKSKCSCLLFVFCVKAPRLSADAMVLL